MEDHTYLEATAGQAPSVDFQLRNCHKHQDHCSQNSEPYHTQDYTLPTAIVVGTEATGLTDAWRTAATTNISIPMQGVIDSMNLSVAAGILIFEAKRQRDFK